MDLFFDLGPCLDPIKRLYNFLALLPDLFEALSVLRFVSLTECLSLINEIIEIHTE